MMQRAYITITKTELIRVLNGIGIRKKKEQDIVCDRVKNYLNEDLPKIIEREYQLYKLGDNKVLILDNEVNK
jgi:hypothetical protein